MIAATLLILFILMATTLVLGWLYVICIILEELREFHEEYQRRKEWRKK